jgi:hypothetical protein
MNDQQELLTIGDVARRAGMRTSALRYYEEIGATHQRPAMSQVGIDAMILLCFRF